jgi:hypothetical protein
MTSNDANGEAKSPASITNIHPRMCVTCKPLTEIPARMKRNDSVPVDNVDQFQYNPNMNSNFNKCNALVQKLCILVLIKLWETCKCWITHSTLLKLYLQI